MYVSPILDTLTARTPVKQLQTPPTDDQWVRCIFIGAMGVPVGVFLRLLPTVSMPQRVTKAPRNRWQKAISQTQKQLSVVERFRRKVRQHAGAHCPIVCPGAVSFSFSLHSIPLPLQHSVEHHVRRKHSVD
jgi:hypothetical protein